MMNRILILSLVLTLASCAHKKSDVENSNNQAPNAISEDVSSTRYQALQAKKNAVENDDPSRIIGSSKITEPLKHEGKVFYLYGAEHLNLENYYFDFPVVYNDAVKKWINYFVDRGRDYFERYSARAGRYAPIIGHILEDHGLPRDLVFLAMAESGFQNNAKSWARAVGPWQFMPYTGKRYGLHIDWYVDERRDPIKATIAAAKYLTKLYKDFGSWELAAAGYNAGEGKISRAISRYKSDSFWEIRNGRYLKTETKNYVPKIMALAIIGKNLKSFGFDGIEFHEPLDFEEIEVGPMTDLFQVAEGLDIEMEEIQRLNPEIQRWFTPPGKNYTLRIPVGMKTVWNECCSKQEWVAKDFMEYRVRGNRAKLADIAAKFRIKDHGVLTIINNLDSPNKTFKRDEVVLLPFRKGQDLKDNMYADLYELPRKEVLRRNTYKNRIKTAQRKAKPIKNPTEYYTVKRGDTLWDVARKTGTSLDTIIVSNLDLIRKRQIRAGDRLAIR
ncbi:MAG: lytic transglycosylase domain-containing protein [Bdellovibrio sp.]